VPLISLPNLAGELVTVERGDGSGLVALSFWATHCDPCRGELAEFDALQREFGDAGFRVLAVNIDGPKTQSRIAGFLNRLDYSFEVVMDVDTVVLTTYNPRGECPFYVVLSDDGTVLRSHSGYTPGQVEGQLREFVASRLSEGTG
jgi:thiol-disulfide isomerase/thioredoxin